MAAGWAELLKWIRQRVAAEARDPKATWTRFQKLAARSERADILKHIVHVGRVLPDQERYRLAVSTTRLLAPIEWPREWNEVRSGLVTALEQLVEETAPDAETSFFAVHELDADAVLQQVGHVVLDHAHALLRRPCRRDELRTVARLCNVGNTVCLDVYRKTIQRSGGVAFIDQDARARYRIAFGAYVEAAAAFNEAVGAVLFEGLDAQVP